MTRGIADKNVGRNVKSVSDATAFVVDVGVCNLSWGYAGDDDPRHCQTAAFNYCDAEERWAAAPADFLEFREGFRPAFLHSFRALPSLLQHYARLQETPAEVTMADAPEKPLALSLTGQLSKLVLEKHLEYLDKFFPNESLKDAPVLFSEATRGPPACSRTLAEVSFETMQVGAFFAAPKASLAAFALGRPTALVVETGPLGITISPVFEGYTLRKHIQQYAVGGLLMDWLLATSLQLWDPAANDFDSSFWPYNTAKKTRTRLGPFARSGVPGKEASVEGREKVPRVDSLYLHQSRRRIIEDMSLSCLVAKSCVRGLAAAEAGGSWRGNMEDTHGGETSPGDDMEDIPYELPDGKVLYISRATALDVTEFIFNPPEAVYTQTLLSPFTEGLGSLVCNWPGLATAVASTAFGCDIDVLPALMGNVVVCGGPSSMEGYIERLSGDLASMAHTDVAYRNRQLLPTMSLCSQRQQQMMNLAPPQQMLRDISQLKIKVAAQSPFDRRFSTWVGGSILGSLSAFDPLWISRAEWDDIGPGVLHRRLVF